MLRPLSLRQDYQAPDFSLYKYPDYPVRSGSDNTACQVLKNLKWLRPVGDSDARGSGLAPEVQLCFADLILGEVPDSAAGQVNIFERYPPHQKEDRC